MKTINTSEKLNDRWLRLFGIPIMAAIISFVLFKDERIKYNIPLSQSLFLSPLIITIGWEINRQILIYFRKRYSNINETFQRVTFSFVCYSFSIMLLFGAFILFYNETMLWDHRTVEISDFFISAGKSFLFTAFFASIYEISYYFRKWEETILEREYLKQENLQSQLNALRNQINPHFIFNCLNVLEALTEERSEKATLFVRELAKVYRYMLKNNDKTLITVEEEINFINAYVYLLQTRYGNKISINNEISDKHKYHMLPPLTLQILVENAVKHNVISVKKPLNISIRDTEESNLVIINNLQKKKHYISSNKIGLINIKKRYDLLGRNDFEVQETESVFKVIIPLIKFAS